MYRISVSEYSIGPFELFQLLTALLLALLDLLAIILSSKFLLFLLPLQFLQKQAALFFFSGDFLKQFALFGLVALKFLLFASLLLALVLTDSLFNLQTVIFFHLKLLLQRGLVLVDFPLTVVIHLIQQIDAGLLSFLPLFLLLLLLLEALPFDQSVQLLLIAQQVLILVLDSGESALGLFALFLLHLFLVFGQLTLLLDDALDHQSVTLLFLSKSLFFLGTDALVLLMDGVVDRFLLFQLLKLLLLDGGVLTLPFVLKHLLLLDSQLFLLVFLFLFELLLDSQDGIPFLHFLPLLLLLHAFGLLLPLLVSLVELGEQHFL